MKGNFWGSKCQPAIYIKKSWNIAEKKKNMTGKERHICQRPFSKTQRQSLQLNTWRRPTILQVRALLSCATRGLTSLIDGQSNCACLLVTSSLCLGGWTDWKRAKGDARIWAADRDVVLRDTLWLLGYGNDDSRDGGGWEWGREGKRMSLFHDLLTITWRMISFEGDKNDQKVWKWAIGPYWWTPNGGRVWKERIFN